MGSLNCANTQADRVIGEFAIVMVMPGDSAQRDTQARLAEPGMIAFRCAATPNWADILIGVQAEGICHGAR